MAELKPKASPDQDKAAPEPKAEEKVVVPIEVGSLKDGIAIKIEGDYVELRLSQYLAEHIGQFRACSHVVARFKHGHAPDISAIHD